MKYIALFVSSLLFLTNTQSYASDNDTQKKRPLTSSVALSNQSQKKQRSSMPLVDLSQKKLPPLLPWPGSPVYNALFSSQQHCLPPQSHHLNPQCIFVQDLSGNWIPFFFPTQPVQPLTLILPPQQQLSLCTTPSTSSHLSIDTSKPYVSNLSEIHEEDSKLHVAQKQNTTVIIEEDEDNNRMPSRADLEVQAILASNPGDPHTSLKYDSKTDQYILPKKQSLYDVFLANYSEETREEWIKLLAERLKHGRWR